MLSKIARITTAFVLAASIAITAPASTVNAASWLLPPTGKVGSIVASPWNGGATCYFGGMTGNEIRIYLPNVWSSNGSVQTVAVAMQLQQRVYDWGTQQWVWQFIYPSYGPLWYLTHESGSWRDPYAYWTFRPTRGNTYRLVAAISWPTGSGIVVLDHVGKTIYPDRTIEYGTGSSCTYL